MANHGSRLFSNVSSARMCMTLVHSGTNGVVNYSYIFLFDRCDLAGSERIKKSGVEGGERLSELQHVNLSLLELG